MWIIRFKLVWIIYACGIYLSYFAGHLNSRKRFMCFFFGEHQIWRAFLRKKKTVLIFHGGCSRSFLWCYNNRKMCHLLSSNMCLREYPPLFVGLFNTGTKCDQYSSKLIKGNSCRNYYHIGSFGLVSTPFFQLE